MFLKSLELNGFKSFAQKTILEFPKGITAIVGPNGSGKSNVIDAIRWILGEREAKNLRGAKSEDLIFAGTPKKARSSLAQVAIHFDNSSGFFPVNFQEISVSREVSRDGVSNYYLNKSEVRAKEIIDFFARSRLGAKGITVINQGSSDMFVKASPEERKAMIEEVLGLKEYQLKKSEAERKFKATLANLEKIKLMIDEVAPRLRTLKRQVSKYQARDQKQTDLIESENSFFGFKTKEIKEGLAKNNHKISGFEEKISAKNAELVVLEKNLEQVESTEHQDKAAAQLREKKSALLVKQSQLQKEFGRIEARLEMLLAYFGENDETFKKEELVILLKEIKLALEKSLEVKEVKKIMETAKELAAKIDGFLKQPSLARSKESQNLEEAKNNLTKELEAVETETKSLEKEEIGLSKNLEEFNQKFRKAFEMKEAKKEEIWELENQKKYIVFENEKLNLRLDDLKSEWLKGERGEKEFIELAPALAAAPVSLDELEHKMFRLRAELMSIGAIDEALVKEAKEVETYYNHLSGQSIDLEKASIDLKGLIEELKEEVSTKFASAFSQINDEFNKFFQLMFGGGNAKLRIRNKELRIKENNAEKTEEIIATEINLPEGEEKEETSGVDIELSLPKKRIKSLEVLSGGEKSLVSIAALFALISVSPPPFLVLDEIDAPLDDKNSLRFAEMIKEFSRQAQFIVVTHNRIVMEAADVLYGVTMNPDGTSKLLSLKLEETKQV